MHQSFEDDPAADTSPPYTSRLRALYAKSERAAPEGDAEWSEASLDRLSALQGQLRAGCYPDDVMANLNAHRVAFVRWLIDHGKLSEDG